MHRLAGGALEKIVQAGDEDESFAVGCEREAEVAEAGADDVLNLGQARGGMQADHWTVPVEVLKDLGDGYGFGVGFEADVDGGEDAAGDGQKVRGELDLIGGEVELLEQLAGVAMAEDGVGGEVVGGVHKVGLGGGGFACSADAGFGVADDAVVYIDEAGLEQGSEGEDVRGRVAAGVCDEASVFDLVAVEFGAAVDGLCLELGGEVGIGVLELVDAAVGGVLETPCAAEVDDLDAVLEGVGNPLAGLLMRRGKEEDFDAGVEDAIPGEGMDLVGAGVSGRGEMGVEVFEERGLGFPGAAKEDGSGVVQIGMAQEQAGELSAGVAADASDGDAGGGWERVGAVRISLGRRVDGGV